MNEYIGYNNYQTNNALKKITHFLLLVPNLFQCTSSRHIDYTDAQCDIIDMKRIMDKTDETALVEGKFKYEKLTNGNKKNAFLCTLCRKEFAYHRDTSTQNMLGLVNNINLATKEANITSTRRQCLQSTQPQIGVQIWKQNLKDFDGNIDQFTAETDCCGA